MALPLDPFAQHEVKVLAALGARALRQLLDAVEKRAEADDVDVACICGRMPPAWQATMLMAHAVERFDGGDAPRDVLSELGADAADVAVAAFAEIGESDLAAELARVYESIDFESDDIDDDDFDDRSNEGPPEPDVLLRIKKKLTALVKGMDVAFPAADARYVKPAPKASVAAANAKGKPSAPKAQKRDSSRAILPEEILALGDDAVPTVVAVVEERAARSGRAFDEEARSLPDRWRVFVLAAGAVDGMLDSGSFAGALWNVSRAKEIDELRAFFDEIEQPDVAFGFAEAREFATALSRGVDPEEIQDLRDVVDLDELDVGDLRRALAQAVAAISEPFPAAD